ncbi:bacillithiol biosynthesis deacetylase BshB1 [Phosphitispora fastidiosa]|uniref:bacillithiol biosynthesis deacetylase BshB1 n=1 Tax=Phosphitispora fastidiosa TaxID=2837202 RepID=UPI001E2CB633|nr:bacillithiol biosynthesis deacetylase BshB1 [Phosphitispora fastidiosa]MBU7008370.1 bacillithiol biosynthesis deacetylase BshB1 [Phosphitispora fastidiosa]
METTRENVDIIAFGAHPDDVEIGAGGLLAKEAALGYRVGIADLTRGEMGTRGTPDVRLEEARKAAEILGAVWRINLGMPDGSVTADHENVMKVARVIRTYRPKVIIAPYWDDRHPDHVNTSRLVTEAHFKAGLRKLEPELEAFRPNIILYYFLNRMEGFSFIVDISEHYPRKQEAVNAHYSQFGDAGLKPLAVLGVKAPLQFIESRDRFQGSQIGAAYGEAFLVRTPVPVADPLEVWGR